MDSTQQLLTSPNTIPSADEPIAQTSIYATQQTQQRLAARPNSPGTQGVQPSASRSRGERIEGIVQTIIMVAIGCAAGAASFRHVHDVAQAHGQPGWLAWADALILEAASVAAGLEIRRRKRRGKPVGFPATTLTLAVALSLAAQVVEAEPSVIGWLAAALPALGFLAMVKMAMGRADTLSDVTTGPAGWSGTVPDRPGPVPAQHGPVPDDADQTRTRPDPSRTVADVSALVPAARAAAQTLTSQGVPLNRTTLARQMRADGHALSTATATALIRLLRNDTPAEDSSGLPAAEPVDSGTSVTGR